MTRNDMIICNRCGKILKRHGSAVEDYLHISKQWGYFSPCDAIIEKMDICYECLKEWEKSFMYEPQLTKQTELL